MVSFETNNKATLMKITSNPSNDMACFEDKNILQSKTKCFLWKCVILLLRIFIFALHFLR